MPLGLGSNLSKTGLTTPGIVTDNLVLKHNYNAGSVIPVSDGAAYFDHAGYISITEFTLSPHDTACSFVFWAWRNVIDDYHIVMGNSGVSTYKFVFFDNTDGDRLILEGNVDGDSITGASSIKAKEWNHFAITTDGSAGFNMYQNGVALSETTQDTFNWDITLNRIGGGSGHFMDGYLCNLGVWNGTALTQPQVKSIMNKNYAGLTDSEKTNLVSWWNLDVETNTSGESGTGGVKDHHGSNHGTLS